MPPKKIVAICRLSTQLIVIAKYEAFAMTVFTLDLQNGGWSKALEHHDFDDHLNPESLHLIAISATKCAIAALTLENFIDIKIYCATSATLSTFPIAFTAPQMAPIVDIVYSRGLQSFLYFTGKDIWGSTAITDDQFEVAANMTITWRDRPLSVLTDAGPLRNFWNTESENFYRCFTNSSMPTSATLLVETKAISSSLSNFSWMNIYPEEKKAVLLWRQPMMSSHSTCLLFTAPSDNKEYAILAADSSLALFDSTGILYLFDIGDSFPIISLSITHIISSKVEIICGSVHGSFKLVCFDISSKSLLKVADFNNLSKSPFSGCFNAIEDIMIVTNQLIKNCHHFIAIIGSQPCGYSLVFHQDTMQLISSSTLSNMYYSLAMPGAAVRCLHSETSHSQSIVACETSVKSIVIQQLTSCLPFVHEATIDLDLSTMSVGDLSLKFAGSLTTTTHRIYLISYHNNISSSLFHWNTSTNEISAAASTSHSNEQKGLFLKYFQITKSVVMEVFEFAITAIDLSSNCELWYFSLLELIAKGSNNHLQNEKISRINHASYFSNHLTLFCGKVSVTCDIPSQQCSVQQVSVMESELEVSCIANMITDNNEIEVIAFWDCNECLIRYHDRQNQQVVQYQCRIFEFRALIRLLTLYSASSSSSHNRVLLVAIDVYGNTRMALITYTGEALKVDNLVFGGDLLSFGCAVRQISFSSSTQKEDYTLVMKFIVSTEKLSYLLFINLNLLDVSQCLIRIESCSLEYQSAVIVSSSQHKLHILLLPVFKFDLAITPTLTWTDCSKCLIVGSIDTSQEPRTIVTGCTTSIERYSFSYFDHVKKYFYTVSWNDYNNQVLTVYDHHNLHERKQLSLLPLTFPFLAVCPKAVAFFVSSYPTHPLMQDNSITKIQAPLCFFLCDLIPTNDALNPFESVTIVFFTLWDYATDQFTVISNTAWKVAVDLYQQPAMINDIGLRHVLMLTADGEISVIGWMMVVDQQEGALELQRLCTEHSKMVTNKKNNEKVLMKIEGDFCLIAVPGHGLELYRLFNSGGRDLVHCSLELLWTVVDSSVFGDVFLLPWFDIATEIWCVKIVGFIIEGKSVYIFSLMIGNEDRACIESQNRHAIISLSTDHHLAHNTCIKINLRKILDFDAWKEEVRLEELMQQCDTLLA